MEIAWGEWRALETQSPLFLGPTPQRDENSHSLSFGFVGCIHLKAAADSPHKISEESARKLSLPILNGLGGRIVEVESFWNVSRLSLIPDQPRESHAIVQAVDGQYSIVIL